MWPPYHATVTGEPELFLLQFEETVISVVVNLLEESGLDTSCCVFFEGRRLAEPSHLRLLLFQLLLQAEKHMEKGLVGVSGFEHSPKCPLGQGGRRLGIFSVGDVHIRQAGMMTRRLGEFNCFPLSF